VLSVLMLGCGHGEAVRPESQQAAATEPEAEPQAASPAKQKFSDDIRDYMGSHFAIAVFAHDRLVEGDLVALREPLTEFAAYRYDDVAPGTWLPWLARIQEAARLAAEAQTLERAASGVAAIAQDCGGCHVALGGGPHVVGPSSTRTATRGETMPARMHRHAWAIDQLWEGLVVPSDRAWTAGAKALADGSSRLAAGESSDAEFIDLLEEVRTLASGAVDSTSSAQRTQTYAALLARCGGCHARAEVTALDW
jgi:hypothetical protein